MANEMNKVPCGGFYLGDGLIIDGDTLKSSGGKQVQTDWNQNNTTAKDYIKNRPGGYTQATHGYEITWDGVVGDKVVVDGGSVQFVKVSDRVFTAEELIGATVTVGGQSSTINNDDIQSQNGVIDVSNGVMVCTSPTTIEGVTIPEAGTYFMKTENGFTSSLSKPDSTTTVKIPAELTTVVGGYDAAERTAVIFDGAVKASDFTERSVSGVSYYFAPIALTEDLVKGTTVSGTINGVQVSGTVGAGHVVLYAIAQVSPDESSGGSPVATIGYDAGNYQIALEKQPESDLTIHLTQTAPAHAVTIPEEYLELTETNAAIETAQNAANIALNGLTSTNIVRSIYFNAIRGAFMTKNGGAEYTFGSTSTNPFPKTAICWQVGLSWGSNAPRGDDFIIAFLQAVKAAPGWHVEGVALDTGVGIWYHISTNYIALDQSSGFSVTFKEMAYDGMFVESSTSGSTKKFRITVDDTGTIKATEVTNN